MDFSFLSFSSLVNLLLNAKNQREYINIFATDGELYEIAYASQTTVDLRGLVAGVLPLQLLDPSVNLLKAFYKMFITKVAVCYLI